MRFPRFGAALVGLALMTALPTMTSGARPNQPTPKPRGDVLWARPLRTLDAAQVRTTLRAGDFEASRVRVGVTAYRLVYRTIDPHRRPTTASGLVVLPDTRTRALRLVSFAHGTASYRGDAPSSQTPDDFAAAPALAYAAAGFAAAAPDYLGLGVGPGEHPYFDIASETSASLDLLRAVRRFVLQHGHRVLPGVDVTGFSQGASAALSLARSLQRHEDAYLRLHAVAGISGGYDFRHAELPALRRGAVPGHIAVAYVSYLLVATDRLHRVYREPGELFGTPYANRVETLFNGSVPGSEMMQALPTSLDALLTPRGLALLDRPTSGLADALATIDDTCSWTPSVPARLYYATGDEQAVTANTDSCARTMHRRGADVPTIDLGPHDYAGSRHLGSAVTGVAATLDWFRSLR